MQKTLRREAILAAAAALFDEGGPAAAGLNAIAARAGFTKSNLYRYFESREDVLLALLRDEFERFASAIETKLAAEPPNRPSALAAATADAFLAQSRFCHLLSILASVLEQNVTEDTIVAMKTDMSRQSGRIAAALQARLPGATLDDCVWATATIGALVTGLWPASNPSPAARRVLARPEFAHLKPLPERDLKRAIEALLASIA